MSGHITKQVYTEVEVDVSLEDFSIKDIIEELQARDCPRQIIELLKRWNNRAISLTEFIHGECQSIRVISNALYQDYGMSHQTGNVSATN